VIPGLTDDEFYALPLAARIHCAAALFLGYRYSISEPRVPLAVGSIPVRVANHTGDERWRFTNCSTMAAFILQAIYAREWTAQDYRDIQLIGTIVEHPAGDSPIIAAERHGLGQRVDEFDADHWHLVQYWRKQSNGAALVGAGGHALLVFFDGSTCTTIEASGTKNGGVGATIKRRPPGYFAAMGLCHRLRLWP